MTSSIAKTGRKGQREEPSGATVSIPLVDLLHDAEAGLLGLSVGLRVLQELMDQEVTEITGPKGQHNPQRTAVRHGVEDGYVFLGDRRVPVTHPRVRTTTGQEVPLTTYHTFQDAGVATQAILERMLFGLASRQQGHANPALSAEVGTHGLSKSAVSRRFIRATQQALDTFMQRSLGDRIWTVLMVDGIRVGGHLVVIALGIDDAGTKRILGLVEGATENSAVVKSLLIDLVERGFTIPEGDGLLAVIDGAKALAKAVRAMLGDRVHIQRCQVHKTRNVLDHLPESMQATVRSRLRKAYQEADAPTALKALQKLAAELERDYPQAANSLREGLDETLTVHRLGLSGTLRRSLSTTNPLESVNSQFRTHAQHVKRWSNGVQVLRWLASASLFLEDRFQRLAGYRDLPQLLAKLRSFAAPHHSMTDADKNGYIRSV